MAQRLNTMEKSNDVQRRMLEAAELLSFAGIPLVTVAEGEISELHIGLKGTMGALYVKDRAEDPAGHGGARVRGPLCRRRFLWLQVVRTIGANGMTTIGERRLDVAEAGVVRRIFTDFAQGRSPYAIAARLNRERVADRSASPRAC